MEEGTIGCTADLGRLAARFQRWRRSRNRGERIPENLWESAAVLAREEGVSPVARALVLDYYRLKERAKVRDVPVAPVEAPSFVELAVDPAGCRSAPEIEVVHRDGARLLIHASAGMDLALEDLVRAFLGSSR